MEQMINISETASEHIKGLLAEERMPYIRTFVQGGGCSGFSYGFTFEEEKQEDDFEIDGVLIDVMSMQYLQGATIDYVRDIMGSQFTIKNPNAKATCGCGSSFSV